ncbi:MAG: threonine dehydratase [Alphaproteobacteria bacterium]|nr:threonine dehydratase [Alphaproteobacteria bacterium]
MTLPGKTEIEAAAELVYGSFPATPQRVWPLLAERAGTEVWVKHENHTPIGAFKIRGGLAYMAQCGAGDMVTATRGNHGQSVAYAARQAGKRVTVVVPEGNSREKNAAMHAFGADLVVHGRDFQDAFEHAHALAGAEGLHFLPSFHPALVAGVATYSYELLSAAPHLDALYVPIGLGSGICGAIAAREALGLRTEIVGVVARKAPCYALSFDAGRAVSTNSADTMADGMACRTPDASALAIILKHAARIVTVDDDEIEAAMRHYFTDTHNVIEGAGAAPLAALLKEREGMAGKAVGLVASGGNIDIEVYRRVLAGD